jgi:hypothetical protein
MNLNDSPTKDQLAALLAACDDRAGHHVLWASRNGEVRVTLLARGKLPPNAAVLATPGAQLRLETFLAGNGYVGTEAVEHESWVDELFDRLSREWAAAKGKAEAVYCALD